MENKTNTSNNNDELINLYPDIEKCKYQETPPMK